MYVRTFITLPCRHQKTETCNQFINYQTDEKYYSSNTLYSIMTLKEWFQTRLCIKKKPVEEDEIVGTDVIGEIEETDNIVIKVKFEEEKKEEKKNDEKRPTSYGSFIRIRDTLDYTYHLSYPEERQWFQDSITETILGDVDSPETTPSEPWLIYLAGSRCSGKNEILQKIEDKGNMPLLSYIFIDTDDIQQRMPENSILRKSISNEAQSRFRKEAKLISEITETAAMEKGKNVVISCSPLTHTWFSKRISVVREKFPQYKIAIIHVTISLSNALHDNAMVGFQTILSRLSHKIRHMFYHHFFTSTYLICFLNI